MARFKDRLGRSDLVDDKDYLNRRFSELKNEYQSFEDHYKELSEFFDPRRGRFQIDDRNKGDKRHKNILNNHGSRALRTAVAGMLAGAMSSSRPWFTFGSLDDALMRKRDNKQWAELLQKVVLTVFNQSNFYNMAPTLLRELLLFGTGCMTHEDDYEDVARFYTHTVGSYYIAQNSRGVVDTLARRFQLTCYQMVQRYGYENVSRAVKNQWDRGHYHSWHTVHHFIELNPFRDETEARFSAEFMRWRSVYWEPGRDGTEKEKYLRRRGYDYFPAYCPRWGLTNEDVYSTDCPGMTALGDTKQLQQQEKEKAKAIAKSSTPPLQGPASFRNQRVNNLPGGVTINTSSNQKLESIYNVDPRVQELIFDIDKTERRISDTFYNDLFMAITQMEGIQPKNELQLTQIHEERLLQLGPVLEQVHGEWLAKMVDRTAMQVLRAEILPPPPDDLIDRELEIEFVSAIAMAQKAVATGAIERTLTFASGLLQTGWDVADKIDPDFALDEYAHLVGSPVRLVKPTEEALAARQAKQAQLQQQQLLDSSQQAADIAKTAGEIDLEGDNVVSRAVSGADA